MEWKPHHFHHLRYFQYSDDWACGERTEKKKKEENDVKFFAKQNKYWKVLF